MRAASARSAAMPWLISSRTESKSETTKPRNPRRRFRMSVMSGLSPVEATPFMALSDVITVKAPASMAARKGGT